MFSTPAELNLAACACGLQGQKCQKDFATRKCPDCHTWRRARGEYPRKSRGNPQEHLSAQVFCEAAIRRRSYTRLCGFAFLWLQHPLAGPKFIRSVSRGVVVEPGSEPEGAFLKSRLADLL